MSIKHVLKRIAVALGYEINKIPKAQWSIKEGDLYQPLYSPLLGYGDFGHYLEISRPYSGLNSARFYVLYSLAQQAARVDGN